MSSQKQCTRKSCSTHSDEDHSFIIPPPSPEQEYIPPALSVPLFIPPPLEIVDEPSTIPLFIPTSLPTEQPVTTIKPIPKLKQQCYETQEPNLSNSNSQTTSTTDLAQFHESTDATNDSDLSSPSTDITDDIEVVENSLTSRPSPTCNVNKFRYDCATRFKSSEKGAYSSNKSLINDEDDYMPPLNYPSKSTNTAIDEYDLRAHDGSTNEYLHTILDQQMKVLNCNPKNINDITPGGHTHVMSTRSILESLKFECPPALQDLRLSESQENSQKPTKDKGS